MSVALAIQQAIRMRRITLSHKGDDFRRGKKVTEYKLRVWIFSTTRVKIVE